MKKKEIINDEAVISKASLKDRPKLMALLAFENDIPTEAFCLTFGMFSDYELFTWLGMPYSSNREMIRGITENKKVFPKDWSLLKCAEWVYLKSECMAEDYRILKEELLAENKDKKTVDDSISAKLQVLDEEYRVWSTLGLYKNTFATEFDFYSKHNELLHEPESVEDDEETTEREEFYDSFIGEDGLCDYCLSCEENGDDEDCANCECKSCENNRRFYLNDDEDEFDEDDDDVASDCMYEECDCKDCCGYDCKRNDEKSNDFLNRLFMANNNELTYEVKHNAIWNMANFNRADVKKIWYMQDITKGAMDSLYNSLVEVRNIFEFLSLMLHKRLQIESKVEPSSTTANYYQWMIDKYFGIVPIKNAPTLPMLFNTMLQLLTNMEMTLYADNEKKVLAKVLQNYTGNEDLDDKKSFRNLRLKGYYSLDELNTFGTEEKYIPLSLAKRDCTCCEECGSWTQRNVEDCDCQLYEEDSGLDVDESELRESDDSDLNDVLYWFLARDTE